MKRIAMLAMLALLATPVLAAAQQCLHGPDETPEQKTRRRAALTATRQINNLQVNRPGAADKQFLDQAEMGAWYAENAKKSGDADPLVFDPAAEVIPGWQLTLDKTAGGYWFMIKDKTDPCGFAFISNQNGLIFTAEPIR